MDMLTKGIGLGLEPLSCNDTVPIDYEQTLFQVLVNEGKHIRVSLHIRNFVEFSVELHYWYLTKKTSSILGVKCQEATILVQR
jgi:hypothetical protein